MFKIINYLKKYRIFIITLIIVLFFTSLHPTFNLDESFTFGLIHNNFHNLLIFNSEDVHPPLYYIILKMFLSVTTFWTKSILVKVIIARMLSVIFLLVFIFYCIKIVNISKNKVSINNILIFVLMPNIILNSVRIRMYSLSSLFLVLELYELLKFNNDDKFYHVILSAIFTSLSAYTFYFSGLSSGILLMIYGFVYLFNKQWRMLKKITIGILLSIIMYLPQIPFTIRQLREHTYINNGSWKDALKNIPFSLVLSPNSIFLAFVAFIILLFVIIFSYRIMNHSFNKILLVIIIDMLLTVLISFVVCGKQYQNGVTYPVNSIIAFTTSCVFVQLFKYSKFVSRFIYIIGIVFLVFTSLVYTGVNIKKYDIPSVTLINNISDWKCNYSKNIVVNKMKYPISKQMTASEDAIYLNSMKKNAVVYDCTYSKLSEGLLNNKSNVTLVKQVFPNLQVRKY